MRPRHAANPATTLGVVSVRLLPAPAAAGIFTTTGDGRHRAGSKNLAVRLAGQKTGLRLECSSHHEPPRVDANSINNLTSHSTVARMPARSTAHLAARRISVGIL